MKSYIAVAVAALVLTSCSSTSPSGPAGTDHGTPTAVGTPIGSPSSATIDAAGGTLVSTDGRLQLIIPAAALPTATPISIQRTTNPAPLGAGVAYSLTPNGLTFSKPVTLQFQYDASDLAGSDASQLTVATQKDDRIWYAFDHAVVNMLSSHVTVSTSHFSAYALINSLRLMPQQAEIAVNATQALEVIKMQKATDDDPNDELMPLASSATYPDGGNVKWTINGNALGTVEDGFVTASASSSKATYTAPSTTDDMSSNPVAVGATVDVPGSAKAYLISNITVSGGPSVAGKITLTVSLSGSKTYSHGIEEIKNESATADLSYDLLKTKLQDVGSFRSAVWTDGAFGGSVNWLEEHITSYNFVCDNVTDRVVSDKETTVQSYSGVADQRTGVGLSISSDSTYTISIGPSTSLNAASTHYTKISSGYCTNPQPQSSTNPSPIPFASYFIPYVGGNGPKTVGKIDPADPTHLRGVYHGTDSYTVFSYNSTVISLPVIYTITWDLTLGK